MSIPRFSPALTVRDCGLAAALAAYHVPPDPRGFEDVFDVDGRRFYCWHFLDRTPGGELTVDLIKAWGSPEEFNEKHPRHPWAYIMIYERNKQGLRERCAKNKPKFLIQRGESLALVDPRAPRATQEAILARIGI